MPAHPLIARPHAAVNDELLAAFNESIVALIEQVAAGTLAVAEVERRVWAILLESGRLLLGAALGVLCRANAEEDLASKGLRPEDVSLRMDDAGHGSLTTTLGLVNFPWFSYRETRGGPTKSPAKALFPLHQRTRTSPLLLEWEAALGSEHPFRSAQRALTFFTHGAVAREDTTIQRHAVAIGRAITRDWLYQTPENIRELLQTRATRDAKTQRPVVYASTDAHMLSRYVDESWNASWKAINGIRVWCIDQQTGEVIHLGGEYTWGDCQEVARLFTQLQEDGILPADGDYGEGVRAQVVLVTDGARWIEERVYPLFSGALVVLDPFHVLERIAAVAGEVHGTGSPESRRLVAKARSALGLKTQRARAPVPRKGRPRRARTHLAPARGSVDALFRVLASLPARERKHPAMESLATYLDDNAYRMAYADLRDRGIRIGSGAMESMHRFSSQLRLKRSGCRWLPETAIAILNLRLLQAVSRWDEYWEHDGLLEEVREAMAA